MNKLDRSFLRSTRRGIKYIPPKFLADVSEVLFHKKQPAVLAFSPLLLNKFPKIVNTSLRVDLFFFVVIVFFGGRVVLMIILT